MSIGGFVYLMALVSFAIAGILLARRGDLMVSRELLFWGGGHLMQFVYAIVLLTNWRILARRSLGEKAVDDALFRAAVAIIGVLAIAGPIFYAVFEPFSAGAARGVPPASVRRRDSDPPVRRPAACRRPRARAARAMAVARSGVLHAGDVDCAVSRSAA